MSLVLKNTRTVRFLAPINSAYLNGDLHKRCKVTAPVASMAAPLALVTQVPSHTDSIKTAVESSDEIEWNGAKPFDRIPGPKLWPFFGSTWVMFPIVGAGIDVTRQLELNKHKFKKFGYIWRDIVPGMAPIVSTVRPEDVEKVFRNDGRFPQRPGFETLKVYRRNRVEHFASAGLLISSGDPWWQIRSKVQQPLLKAQNMNNYLPVVAGIADEFIDRIRSIRQENNEMRPDFLNEMYRWALESVGVVALNARLGCLDPDLSEQSEALKMIQATNLSFAAVNQLEFGLPVWKYYKTPLLKRLFEAQDFFTDTAIKYVQRTVEQIENRPKDSDEEPTILEQLFARGLSPKDAIALVIDMLMAGIDTTSHTTSFLLYLLARNPDKQEELRKEIMEVVGPKGSPLKTAALNDLHYLKACVKESFRMMPATIGNARYISKDMVLSGYQVPKGTLVAAQHQLMCRLDEYFPRAERFLPERWIKGHTLESHAHPYVMLPFGFGTRMCIGRRLAEMEMYSLTIKMLQHFRVEYHYEDIGCISRLVNIPDQPLRFKFIDVQ